MTALGRRSGTWLGARVGEVIQVGAETVEVDRWRAAKHGDCCLGPNEPMAPQGRELADGAPLRVTTNDSPSSRRD